MDLDPMHVTYDLEESEDDTEYMETRSKSKSSEVDSTESGTEHISNRLRKTKIKDNSRSSGKNSTRFWKKYMDGNFGHMKVAMVEPTRSATYSHLDSGVVDGEIEEILEQLANFCAKSDTEARTLTQKLLEFWLVDEKNDEHYGAMFLDRDIPQLRYFERKPAKAYYPLNKHKKETKRDDWKRKQLEILLYELQNVKYKYSQIVQDDVDTFEKTERTVHNRLVYLMMHMFSSLYETNLRFDGSNTQTYYTKFHTFISTTPDMLLGDDSEKNPKVAFEVCGILLNSTHRKKRGEKYFHGASTSTTLREASSYTHKDEASSYTHKNEASNYTHKNEASNYTHKNEASNYTLKDEASNYTHKNEEVFSSSDHSGPERDFMQYGSRELPDVLLDMEFTPAQKNYILQKLYGQMICHLMGTIVDANKGTIVDANTASSFGFYVQHEAVIPVKLVCPAWYCLQTSMAQLPQNRKTQFQSTDDKDLPVYSVLNWHLDLSKPACRRALACFLKFHHQNFI